MDSTNPLGAIEGLDTTSDDLASLVFRTSLALLDAVML